MAINLTRGDTRPFLIGVAVLTLLGWGLYLYAELDKADNQHGARREILALSVIQDGLKTQLADQEQAAGSIADLQAKIIAASTRLSEATQARDQAQAQLASVQKELETWRQQQAQGAQQLQDLMQQLFRARAETQEVEQRRMAALSEITAHPQAKADRSQELADVGNQLEVARQQETQSREDLARLAQETAVKTAAALWNDPVLYSQGVVRADL
jgi:chromosome segregation ATPase